MSQEANNKQNMKTRALNKNVYNFLRRFGFHIASWQFLPLHHLATELTGSLITVFFKVKTSNETTDKFLNLKSALRVKAMPLCVKPLNVCHRFQCFIRAIDARILATTKLTEIGKLGFSFRKC